MSVTFVFLLGLCLANGKNIPYNVDIQQQIDAFLAQTYGLLKRILSFMEAWGAGSRHCPWWSTQDGEVVRWWRYKVSIAINEPHRFIEDRLKKNINGRNMITVPPNCLPGQALVNGVCRDIWRSNAVTEKSIVSPRNMVTVPINCPVGQELVNGVCRDIWKNNVVTQRSIVPKNMVSVPTNCPSGQQLVNGVCRDIWRNIAVTPKSVISPKNVVTVPTNCPAGQELVNGVCRDIWRNFAVTQRSIPKNMVTVPTNCPDGQQLVNGVCRDIWRNGPLRDEEYLGNLLRALAQQEYLRTVRQADGAELNIDAEDLLRMNVDRNIISVPNQCPAGYRPDSFGICREILP